MLKITNKQMLIDKIFKPDKITGVSKWKTRQQLSKTNLKLSLNGNSRHGKFYNDNRYNWQKKTLDNLVVAIRTSGFDINKCSINDKRPIRKDIKQFHLKTGCVVCGSFSSLVVDHKNDLYNDNRVLNVKTQVINDFQCLCTHCNLQKRQVIKDTKKLKKRYKATNIKSLKIFNIDFISGDESLNFEDPNAMVGTYWHDPVAFMEFIKSKTNQ